MQKNLPSIAIVFLILSFLSGGLCRAAEQPNFVWILAEDSSTHYYEIYHSGGASTPNIQRLANRGLRFEHAFSNSPVCSVARTTLMTALYAPRVGTQYHRKMKEARLPEGWRMFPAYLRQAGYHTTNNSKKDYNSVEGAGVWNASSSNATWRDRPKSSTPFFHMRTFGQSHESSLHFSEAALQSETPSTPLSQIQLPPYYPDTELFRYTYARYLDRIRIIDDEVGELVSQLEEDGLLEDTFIFFFGDHGGVLPGSKGYLYETGLHVPLVVRIPENWKHLCAANRGQRIHGFVSFVDFGPTLLRLAGIEVPGHMDGKPFLGPDLTVEDLNRRNEAFGYADRFDEKYDLCRSLRKGQFKYIRNYQAYHPDALQNNYRYRMLAYQQWRQFFHDGKLNIAQSRFFQPKPAEVLYDLENDPHEIYSLAANPQYLGVLKDMRSRLTHWIKEMPDLSFLPESELVEKGLDHPVEFGAQHKQNIARWADIADLSLLPIGQAEPALRISLQSPDPWDRYWALIAASCFGSDAKELLSLAEKKLEDPEPLVRVRAAEFLAIAAAKDPWPTLLSVLKTTESPVKALLTLNTVVYLKDFIEDIPPLPRDDLQVQAKNSLVERRLEYLSRGSS